METSNIPADSTHEWKKRGWGFQEYLPTRHETLGFRLQDFIKPGVVAYGRDLRLTGQKFTVILATWLVLEPGMHETLSYKTKPETKSNVII